MADEALNVDEILWHVAHHAPGVEQVILDGASGDILTIRGNKAVCRHRKIDNTGYDIEIIGAVNRYLAKRQRAFISACREIDSIMNPREVQAK